MKNLFILIVLWFVCFSSFADKREFIREYTYIAGENDSKTIAKENALKQIKSLLLEELGTYIESYVNYSEAENNNITKDFFNREIKTISGGITETKIIEENWNGYEYYMKAQIMADPEEVIRKINESLMARRNSAAIDSLKSLLFSTSKEVELKDKELENYKMLLSEQRKIVSSRAWELEKMQDELVDLRLKLIKYENREKIIRSEIQDIEDRIRIQSDFLLKNARKYMTFDELKKVCGEPASSGRAMNHKYAVYGSFVAYFKEGNDILDGVCRISAYDFTWGKVNPQFNILNK